MFDPFAQPISTTDIDPNTVYDITLEDIQETPEGQQEIAEIIDAGEAAVDKTAGQKSVGEISYVTGLNTFGICGYFAYDLETVPDESRFPRPEKKEIVARSFNYVDALKTEASITAEIQAGITPEQASELLEMESGRSKPRQGVVRKLQAAQNSSGDDELDQWKKLALDPLGCRIVAVGVCYHSGVVEVMTAKNLREEFELLVRLFEVIGQGTRIGYNIAAFDDPVIMTRAMMLNVPVSSQIHVSRWGGKNSVDIMQKLFPNGTGGGSVSCKLKNILPMFGIQPPAGDVDGSHVLDMVEGGQWDELEKYVASDAWSEMQLFRRMQKVLVMS